MRSSVYLLCLGLLSAAVWPAAGHAQDDARADAMLAALQDRGYLELADYYLERLDAGQQVSDDWKRRIPFARASILIDVAATSQSEDLESRLDDATKLLKKFVEDNPVGEEAEEASMQLAKMRMAQGHRAVWKSESTEDAAAKKSLLDEAGKAFRSAERQFRQRKNILDAQIKEANDSAEPALDQAALDKLRRDFRFARLTVAMLEYDQANVARDDEQEFQKQIKEAQKEFGKIFKDFREQPIGLEAIYYQGRCSEDLGDLKTALDYYGQLMQLTDLPEQLTDRTLARVIGCNVNLERAARAVTMGERWLARGGERSQTSEAAEVGVSLAEAYIAAAQLESGRQQQRNIDAAREQLMRAIRIPNPRQGRARVLLATLPAAPVKPVDPSQIGDFDAAKLAAEQARDQMQSTKALVELQRRKVETAEAEEHRAAAQTELEAAERNYTRLQVGSLAQYRRALAMSDGDTPPEDLNEVRYMIAFMNYQLGQHMRAAAVAEFVAIRFPESSSAKDCANIAMACYWNLHQRSSGSDKSFETQHMIRIADLISSRWPGGAEAEGALVNLVNLTVAQGDVAKAESYLKQIPVASAARVPAELRTGAGLWRQWQRQSRVAAEDGSVPDATLLQRAETLLTGALEKSREKPVDAAVAQAALALAQLQVETGRATDAVALLRDEMIGPMALINQQQTVASGAGFVELAYRTMLKALIGQLAEGNADPGGVMDQAAVTMDALKQVVGDSAEGQRRLITTYVSLAKDLRGQIEVAKPDTQDKLRGGFVAFLKRVADSSESFGTRHWVAETYLGMADDIIGADTPAQIPDEARQFYENALGMLASLIAMPDDAEGMSPQVRIQLQLQLASANRRLGNHKDAIDLFETVLKQRNSIINVQVEAAQTLQEAGAAGSNNLYELAVRGARKNSEGANTIWGWERLAKIAAGQMQKGPEQESRYSDVFFQSRLNVARCRFLQATRAGGDERAKYVGQATRAIKITRSLYPELGGDWKPKFVELAGEISALGGG